MLSRVPDLNRHYTPGHSHWSWLLALCGALAISSLSGLALVGAGQGKAQPQPQKQADPFVENFIKKFTEPIQIGQSKPVTVNNARFALAAQTNWKPPEHHRDFPRVAPIAIQLHITNLGKGDVLFPTNRALRVRLRTAEGNELKPREEGTAKNPAAPILLSEGGTFSLCRRAELRWDEEMKSSDLLFYDGTGVHSVIGPLKPGHYKLALRYSASPDKNKAQKVGAAPTWSGEAVTDEVAIDVLHDATRGIGPGQEHVGSFTEPIRVRESKPVAMNGAEFVTIAQADWRGVKRGEVAPIKLQLRIKNISKTALLFPTFDTFGVKILNPGGERIMPSGGRDRTIVTRPVLLLPGASYSLGAEGLPHGVDRRAELCWDAKTEAFELTYYDGTGWAAVFGPLDPGRYKLSYWYVVGASGPFRTLRDPATWLGEAVTEQVDIDLDSR